MIKEHQDKLKANFELHGSGKMRKKLLEEVCELLTEVARMNYGTDRSVQLCEEYADVCIVLFQLNIEVDMTKAIFVDNKKLIDNTLQCLSKINSNGFIQEHDFYFLGQLSPFLDFDVVEQFVNQKVGRL